MQIHPTALIQEGARLGACCVIHAHAVISGHCELGEGVVVHPFAVIGGDPQDVSFDANTQSGVRIGARTVIREHVTINRATKNGTSTEIGSDCFLMASCHVAHDCRVGDRVVITNAVLLAGHVLVGDRAFLGGGAVIHQFCRIGESAMIGGGARISRDVAPYTLATERNAMIGLNFVGLRRRGFPARSSTKSNAPSERSIHRWVTCGKSLRRACSVASSAVSRRGISSSFSQAAGAVSCVPDVAPPPRSRMTANSTSAIFLDNVACIAGSQ